MLFRRKNLVGKKEILEFIQEIIFFVNQLDIVESTYVLHYVTRCEILPFSVPCKANSLFFSDIHPDQRPCVG